jgi:hypothetical protein
MMVVLGPTRVSRSLALGLVLQPPENQRLYKDEVPLEDARRLAELHIENDDILALTFLKEGAK